MEALHNPYYEYIEIDDFIPFECREETLKSVAEVFFRNHSGMKTWYKYYCQLNDEKYEEGFFMDTGLFFKMMKEMRLCNGRLNLALFTELMLTYEERELLLSFNDRWISKKIEIMKRIEERENIEEQENEEGNEEEVDTEE